MAEKVLEMLNICKNFGGVQVLKNVNFNLSKGKIHALIGGNGAGKSTLMKIMTGVYSCDSGQIVINGEAKKITNPNIARDCGIKMIFQELSLVPTLTVAENIYLNHELKKNGVIEKKKMEQAAKELLADIGINVDVSKKVFELEVGVCQLIEIAKALSTEFSVLVMDEPTASLTEEETKNLFRIMRNLKDKGVSIVYISHRLKEVLEIADEITVLRDGCVVSTLDKSEFTMEGLIVHIVGKSESNNFSYLNRDTKISDRAILEVENLSWPGNPNAVSFKIKAGEVLGLVGLLGSGRTEIVETLFGIRKQRNARILLDGKEVRIKNVRDAINKGIALIPEDRRTQGLTLMHSIMENIILPNLHSYSPGGILKLKKCRVVAKECIDEFKIKATGINDKMLSLSGGNQQKVVISKWFKSVPKVLLMDEPTAGVDIGAKTEIIDIIRKFTSQQRSVVFISSELSEVMAICDRVLVVKNGRIEQEILRREINTEEELQHAIQA